MDGSSTAATSPPPSGIGNGIKLDENINPIPQSDSQVSSGPGTSRPQSPPIGNAAKRPTNGPRDPDGLNKPKSEHMQYFLNSLPQQPRSESSTSPGDIKPEVESIYARSRSPGRVPAVVQAFEEAHKRSSMSDTGSVRNSQEIRPINRNGASPAPTSAPRFGDPADTLPTEFDTPNDLSSVAAVAGKHITTADIRHPQLPGDSRSATESSPPISVLSSSARYQLGRDPPLEDGSTALHHKTNIKSIGLKQLLRSISTSIRKSTHRFKKLVLRRAKTIPNQFSAAVHGHVPHVPLEADSKKLVTRNQRIEEYKSITRSLLPTFGPRVPTPEPYQPPISRRPSLELKNQSAAGLPISKDKASAHLANGESSNANTTVTAVAPTATNLPNSTHNPVHSENSTSGDPKVINNNLQNGADAAEPTSKTAPGVANEKPNAVQKENTEGPATATGFIRSAFTGW
ncbi:hypothetical protein ABW20_dc0106255 [Dactylellina cionopaga]|nr:hypothetical protein ABW20_dc0106255 [Dactylellina cionopaga]